MYVWEDVEELCTSEIEKGRRRRQGKRRQTCVQVSTTGLCFRRSWL